MISFAPEFRYIQPSGNPNNMITQEPLSSEMPEKRKIWYFILI